MDSTWYKELIEKPFDTKHLAKEAFVVVKLMELIGYKIKRCYMGYSNEDGLQIAKTNDITLLFKSPTLIKKENMGCVKRKIEFKLPLCDVRRGIGWGFVNDNGAMHLKLMRHIGVVELIETLDTSVPHCFRDTIYQKELVGL